MDTRELPVSLKPNSDILVASPTAHTTYAVVDVDFTIRLTERDRHIMSPVQIKDYLLAEAARGIAEQLVGMDDLFTIDSNYRVDLRETHVNHRLKVLKERN